MQSFTNLPADLPFDGALLEVRLFCIPLRPLIALSIEHCFKSRYFSQRIRCFPLKDYYRTVNIEEEENKLLTTMKSK